MSSRKEKHVENVREEIKFIKRYVNLHGKKKSPTAILNFIKVLQKSIAHRLIRKVSSFATEIRLMQDHLIKFYKSMRGEKIFRISESNFARFMAIAGSEKVYPSIVIIKRFIQMQGREITNKRIESFLSYMEHLAKKKILTKADPYKDQINLIYSVLKGRKKNFISTSPRELNGLQEIVNKNSGGDLGVIYKKKGRRVSRGKLRQCRKGTYTDSRNRGACSYNRGLSGVLTAEQMANRTLDLLSFFSIWLSLFGMPARNFTMMLHGEPHHGKTILLLKLAQFLAENFGNVLYVSSEEFSSPTMTKKVNEFLSPLPARLDFIENVNVDSDLSKYQFIILDSVNDLGLKIGSFKEIRKAYPNTAFIFILQHTKAGEFRGGKDWEHLAEIVGEVHKGTVMLSKNRYAPKSSLDFFRQFSLVWEEPNQVEGVSDQKLLKPYPLNGDLITSDNSHF